MAPIIRPTKVCTACKEEKPRAAFSRHAKAINGVLSWCKACSASKARERNAADPHRLAATNRASKLKRKYGISLEEYDLLVDLQGGCAVCGTKSPGGRRGAHGEVFHVDHCHATGRVRGLLCHACNTAIGLLKDNPAVAAKASDYLRRHAHAEPGRHL